MIYVSQDVRMLATGKDYEVIEVTRYRKEKEREVQTVFQLAKIRFENPKTGPA